MTLDELIAAADDAYPDGLIGDWYRHYTMRWSRSANEPVDTLAKFIMLELVDTYDERASTTQQLSTARNTLRTALRELQGVIDAL